MKYGFFSFFFLLFSGCTSFVDTKLEWALSLAAENKAELEKVLAHYEKDSLKYEAARLLIENMVGKGRVYVLLKQNLLKIYDIIPFVQPFIEENNSHRI